MDIIPVYTSSGKQKFAVKIKFGGEFSYLGKKNTEKSIEDLSSSQIINELIEKGVINTYNLRKIENPGLQIKNNSYKNLVIRLFIVGDNNLCICFTGEQVLENLKLNETTSQITDRRAESILYIIQHLIKIERYCELNRMICFTPKDKVFILMLQELSQSLVLFIIIELEIIKREAAVTLTAWVAHSG